MATLRLFLILFGFAFNVPAVEIATFDDPQKGAIYQKLIGELRCLVCQNQSLADSDADLAKDLRTEIHGMIQKGQGEAEIVQFLTDRYGDFVLYDPPLKPLTLLLWAGPLLMLIVGGFWLRTEMRRHSPSDDGQSLDASDAEALRALRKRLESR